MVDDWAQEAARGQLQAYGYGAFDAGVLDFQRAIELDPFSSRAYAALAAANLWTDRLEEAVKAARRAVLEG